MALKTYKTADFSSLSRSLDTGWLTQALSATGKASVRKRKLDARKNLPFWDEV